MGLRLFNERYRRALRNHDEFSKILSDHDRSALWQSNQAVASALTMCKVCKPCPNKYKILTYYKKKTIVYILKTF